MRTAIQPLEGSSLFYSPFTEPLIKAVDEDGRWMVYLEASNEALDQDNETTMMEALQKAADYYVTHGVISWDHQHKIQNNPNFIIGEPLDVKFTKDRKTLVKGFLYKENENAQGVWKNLNSGAKRLGSSVGGFILHKSQGGKISKVFWDDTAITHKPVNDTTYGAVANVPYKEFMKAMMAGDGVDAAAFSGGRALAPESLQGASTGMSEEQVVNLFNQIWTAIAQGEIKDLTSLLGFIVKKNHSLEVAKKVAAFLYEKLPFVASNL